MVEADVYKAVQTYSPSHSVFETVYHIAQASLEFLQVLGESRTGIRSPRAGVTGSCEQPDMGARNLTCVLWKRCWGVAYILIPALRRQE